MVLDLNGARLVWDTEMIGQKMPLLAQSKLSDVRLADWFRQEPNWSPESSDQ